MQAPCNERHLKGNTLAQEEINSILMSRTIKVAISQSHTLSTPALTLDALSTTTQNAASQGVHLLLFPEAYLGGYPRGCTFGSDIGSRSALGREQYLAYRKSAVDLGDTPRGAGDAWTDRKLPAPPAHVDDGNPGGNWSFRGDGTREFLERVAKETGVFLVVGLVERAGGSLYCSVVYVDPIRGCVGKRRKVMPTGAERIVWAQGQPETLRAVTAVLGDGVKVILAAAVCWENYMPLLRSALYAQGVNLWCAPTADGRDTWLSLMRTIGIEGRCFVLSGNQCLRSKDLPEWLKRHHEEAGGAIVTDGKKLESETSEGDQEVDNTKPPTIKRRESVVTKTEDNHEITWPALHAKSGGDKSGAETKLAALGLNGNSSSPLRFSEIPQDDSGTGPIGPTRKDETRSKKHVIALPSQALSAHPYANGKRNDTDFVSHGGSCIVSPNGDVLAGPFWDDDDGLLVAAIDLDDCERGLLDLDVSGHYSRHDSFELSVRGLTLDPPP